MELSMILPLCFILSCIIQHICITSEVSVFVKDIVCEMTGIIFNVFSEYTLIMSRFCFRRLPRRRCFVLTFIAFMVVVSSIHTFVKHLQCSNSESIHILNQLCQDYYDERLAGNLCPRLCDFKQMQFDACTNYQGGKHVFRMKWNDFFAILKSKKPSMKDYDLSLGSQLLESFSALVADSVFFNLPVKRDNLTNMNVVSKMWMDDVEKYIEIRQTDKGVMEKFWHHGAMDSLWSLLQQDEYLLFRFFEESHFFPKLYGSCGNFYAVEYMPPGRILAPPRRLLGYHLPWKDRAMTALKLLALMEGFDEHMPQTLHMCDMKAENFGISSSGHVAAIDVDMAIFDERLKSDLFYPNCTKHNDCSFFDCEGWCDMTKGRCTGIRTNNNLQILCEKVLLNHMSNFFTGLLNSPPNSVPELKSVLSECARPPPPTELLPGCQKFGNTIHCPTTSDKKYVRYKADKKYYKVLKHLIEKSLR